MPFRERYLGYDDLTAVLESWARQHPELVRLRSLGTTREGRSIWCATIGRDPDRVRPAMLVDANQHASELCGTNVALALARSLLDVHLDADSGASAEIHGVPRGCHEALREGLLHVVPRVSPDGA